MPTVTLPLASDLYKNVYGDSCRDALLRLVNCYQDRGGSVVGFPGQTQLVNVVSAAPATLGAHYFRKRNKLLLALPTQVRSLDVSAGASRFVYAADASGDAEFSSNLVTLTDTGDFQPTTIDAPALWGTDGATRSFLAAGGRSLAHYTTFSPPTETYLDFSATHVDYLDTYMLANVAGTNQFRFSDVLDPTTWGLISVFSAIGSNDEIVALYVLNRRIYLFGQDSIEVWENDGLSPFSRVGGGFIQTGTVSPYSIVPAVQSLFWLDRARRFSTFSGSNVQILPSPFDTELHKFGTVSDCRGFTFDLFGSTFILWDFPSAQRTFCLIFHDDSEIRWCELGRYQGDRYTGMREHLFVYLPEYGTTVCVAKDAAIVFGLNPASRTMGSSQVPMRSSVLTGSLDFGTLAMKRMNRLRLRVKRGYGGSAAAQMMLRYRDDNAGPWTERLLDLGATGDTNINVQMLKLGAFRSRQFEFAMTDSVPFNLTTAEAEIDVLGK